MTNTLYYGDNLDVLRKHIRDETVDLCYIDPPFNSKRNYNQIYNNIGGEDRAQAQAFVDTWTWDDHAIECYRQILENSRGLQTSQSIDLMSGLERVLGRGGLFAYLVSMNVRAAEIHRVLKQTGTFYLHCDPTASHYLKLVIDSVFVPRGGDYLNEIVWCYSQGGKSKKWFARKHDVIFWYSKSPSYYFDGDSVRLPLTPHKQDKTGKSYGGRMGVDEDGRAYVEKWGTGNKKLYRYYLDKGKIPEDWWIDINSIQADANERQGYPTQKPEALLERIIASSSEVGGVVLDAYCGCGTTVVVAERLKRRWIGIDITYQSISLVLHRLENIFGKQVTERIKLNGIPQDMESADALAHKKDDRVRKEFEKWAVLTYTENHGIISDKKGADRGIDGVAYTGTGKEENAKIVFQVKSGHVGRGDVAKLRGDMAREEAEMAVLITLEEPTAPMHKEAKAAGKYQHPMMNKSYDRIQIVTVKEMVEQGKRLNVPLSREVLRTARADAQGDQLVLGID